MHYFVTISGKKTHKPKYVLLSYHFMNFLDDPFDIRYVVKNGNYLEGRIPSHGMSQVLTEVDVASVPLRHFADSPSPFPNDERNSAAGNNNCGFSFTAL